MNYIHSIRMKKFPKGSCYPFNIPSVRYFKNGKEMNFEKPVTFFVGENGTGKSTLLEAIAVAYGFNAEGGSKDFDFESRETHSELYEYVTLSKDSRMAKDGFFLRAESFYNVASYLDDYSSLIRYGDLSFHEQSHGESFMALVENRFEGEGIYILDEPEAALSPQKLMSLLVLIDNLVKDKSQFIISTHSPILMAYPNAEIYEFSEKGIEKVNFKDTEHYKITKMFVEKPEQMIKYLLE